MLQKYKGRVGEKVEKGGKKRPRWGEWKEIKKSKVMKMTWSTTSTALLPCLWVPSCKYLQPSQQSFRGEPSFPVHCAPNTALSWTGCFSFRKDSESILGKDLYAHYLFQIAISQAENFQFRENKNRMSCHYTARLCHLCSGPIPFVLSSVAKLSSSLMKWIFLRMCQSSSRTYHHSAPDKSEFTWGC